MAGIRLVNPSLQIRYLASSSFILSVVDRSGLLVSSGLSHGLQIFALLDTLNFFTSLFHSRILSKLRQIALQQLRSFLGRRLQLQHKHLDHAVQRTGCSSSSSSATHL